MGCRDQLPRKLTVKQWERILRNALDAALKRKLEHDPRPNNYGTPFYLIPRRPDCDGERK